MCRRGNNFIVPDAVVNRAANLVIIKISATHSHQSTGNSPHHVTQEAICRYLNFNHAIFGAFVFVLGLGFGLSHTHWFYAREAILLVLMIAVNEWLLRIPKAESSQKSSTLAPIFYPRHRRLIQDSGIPAGGQKVVERFVQLTKRDVGILFFVLLALAGFPQWILHLWVVVTAISLTVTAATRLRTLAGS